LDVCFHTSLEGLWGILAWWSNSCCLYRNYIVHS
jgi:hypothetical protein